jgi:hypothetical protein
VGADGRDGVAGVLCDSGSAVVGFNLEGVPICMPVVRLTPTPTPTREPSASGESISDTTAPTLAAFDFQPRSVSVTTGAASVKFTARILDDLGAMGTRT